MNFDSNFPPRSKDGETVVWEHQGAKGKPLNTSAVWTVLKVLNRVIMVLILAFWVWMGLQYDWTNLSQPEFWTEFLKCAGPVIAVLIIGLAIGKYLQIRNPKLKSKFSASGIPLWLSTTRLAFEPAVHISLNILVVKDIQSVNLDFSEGARALNIETVTHSLSLISSDAANLLRHLYTLRPDLEPAS